MEQQTKLIEEFFDKSEKYIKSSFELYKLKSINKSAEIISYISSKLVILIFFLLSFLILNIAIAYWIGDVLEKNYLGFLIVAGFYAFITIVLLFFRKSILKTPIQKSIINQFINE